MATGIRRLFESYGVDEAGTPTTQTVRDRILLHVRRGLPAEVAAQAAGINRRTFLTWIQAGHAALAEITADPQAQLTAEQQMAAEFTTDLDSSMGAWLSDANLLLEAETRRRVITTTKETTLADGTQERSVTTREEPGDLARLSWRMKVAAPRIYGTERVEVTGADGGAVEIDIGERLAQVMADIAATLVVKAADPAEANGHTV